MKTDALIRTDTTPDTFSEPAQMRLRQFVLYDDYNAGVAGRWLAAEIVRAAAPACDASSIGMSKTNFAMRPGRLREMALQEAGEADVLMVAASEVSAPEPAVLEWLDALAPWKANR